MKKILKYTFITILIACSFIAILGGGFGDRNDYKLINQGEPIIFAHRGLANSVIENSSASFTKSDSAGFNAIETDISCTKDGKLILFHDENCKRLLGIDTNISELNWADIEAKKLLYKGEKTKNKVLSLDEFLNQTKSSKILYLDMKKTTVAIADSLLSILKKHHKHKNIIIADANLLFLAYLKTKNPKIIVALEGFNKGKEWIYHIIPKKFKPDYYSSFLTQVDRDHLAFFKNHNISKNKIVYGVNINNLKTVYDLNIKNIILDYKETMAPIDSITINLAKDTF